MKYVKWFEELRKADVDVAGGKGANLGELTSAKVPVPPGFVVLSTAYFAFLDENHLRPEIHRVLKDVDVNDSQALNKASKEIMHLIAKGKFPDEIVKEVFAAYHKLGHNALVAVRSSATAEDLPDASFAGQQESYLNIHGDANVIMKIRECYESLFGPRSIFYREQKKYDHFKVGIAVPVQEMVQSEVSGVMFTVDPITKDKDKIVIEGAFGLGDYVVQGVVTPDHYEVSKSSGEIISKQVNKQEIMEIRSLNGVKKQAVPAADQEKQKLPDAKIKELASIGKAIQQHYLFPRI